MPRPRSSARTGHNRWAIGPPPDSPTCPRPSPPRQPPSIDEEGSPPTRPHPRVRADISVPQHLPAPPANVSAGRPPRPPHRAGYRGQCPPARATNCPRALDNPEMSPSFLAPVTRIILIALIYTPFIGWENTRAKICGIPSMAGLGYQPPGGDGSFYFLNRSSSADFARASASVSLAT